MTDKPVPLTREGRAKIEAELADLHGRQKDVAERIHKAQELGTSQNDAEYDDAKNEQGMLQGRHFLRMKKIHKDLRASDTELMLMVMLTRQWILCLALFQVDRKLVAQHCVLEVWNLG